MRVEEGRRLTLDALGSALRACSSRRGTARALDARFTTPPFVIGFGKCAASMMRGVLDVARPARSGVIVPPGHDVDDLRRAGVEVAVGAHPEPSLDAAEHAAMLLDIAGAAPPGGELVVLASGGGSALFERPIDGFSMRELRDVTRALQRAGATIHELNAVRASLSRVKSGGLLDGIRARVTTLVVEDVPGHPELVASGPTFPRSPSALAREVDAVFERYSLTPPSVWRARRAFLATHRGPAARRAELVVVADNAAARGGVVDALAATRSEVLDRGHTLTGEARRCGAALAVATPDGQTWVHGGETTVTVQGAGRGGRNLEWVLGGFIAALERGRVPRLVASFGTDGVDGSSGCAGAFLVDEHAAGFPLDDARRALDANDTASFFEQLGTTLAPGPTGENVCDVAFVMA